VSRCIISEAACRFETQISAFTYYSSRGYHSSLLEIKSTNNKSLNKVLNFFNSAPRFDYNILYKCETCMILGACYAYAITKDGLCFCDLMLDRNHCNFSCVNPFVFVEDGSEYCTFTCEDDSQIIAFLSRINDLAKVEVLHKSYIKEAPLHPLKDLNLFECIPNETSKIFQLSELETTRISKAIAQGYFDVPSRASLSKLASEENVSKSAFSESLRKAQLKILRFFVNNARKSTDKEASRKDNQSILIKLKIQRDT
jgi:hypothetical protein